MADISNVFFRIVDGARLFFYRSDSPIKLHLGCGDQHKNGYLNIDWRKTGVTDFVCNISSIPIKDNSVSVIESYHVIEHLSEHDAIGALEHWYKLLNSGGKIVVECPDLDRTLKEYLDGNKDRIHDIFGYRRFPGDAHLFGYDYESLKALLVSIGFNDVCSATPQDYHVDEQPCLRVEGVKG